MHRYNAALRKATAAAGQELQAGDCHRHFKSTQEGQKVARRKS
jgi:hypothetical protein